jgi:hypothetical protein
MAIFQLVKKAAIVATSNELGFGRFGQPEFPSEKRLIAFERELRMG